MSKATTRLTGYAVLVFLTSALVLVVEMVAARLIAPFVGVSLYSWTAIIGVVLAGLSLGNWAGGVWQKRGQQAWQGENQGKWLWAQNKRHPLAGLFKAGKMSSGCWTKYVIFINKTNRLIPYPYCCNGPNGW